ncbi:oligosaccharyl transferase subunit ost3/OST6 [Allomyces arbusculus]|nr:oligosaccharyl transferase subunit ost3/OST6 [Allomyces arbusculus]
MAGSFPSAREAARVRWMAILATLIVALLLSVAVPRVDAYTMGFKHKKMASVTKESGVMILDANAFNVITEAPRNYSVVVVLTAMSPQIGCAACHQFEPEFKAVSYSRSKTPGQHPLHFASIDFESGREVFQRLGLQSAPNVFLYPATTGPFKLDDGGAPYLNYDLARRGVAAETLADWLSTAINEPLPVTRPLDMTLVALGVAGVIVVGVTWRLLYRGIMALVSHRKTWGILSMALILAFTSGIMWNQIRKPPRFAARQDGSIEYVAPAFQSQHGIETQMLAMMHGTCAVATLLLILAVPKIQSVMAQRGATITLITLVVLVYSGVVRTFLIKNPGYPYRLL